MTYRIVTITSGEAKAWYYLQKEFYRSLNGFDVLTLQPTQWLGLSTKPKVLYEVIKSGMIKERLMIFTDSWDAVFAATPDEVIDRYETHFQSSIVISSETNCFPSGLKEDFDKLHPKTKYAYLNSGFIVGETDAIFACLEAMDLPNLPDDHYDPVNECNVHPNDQFEWMKIFVKQPVKIELDYHQILSQTLHDASIDDFDLEDERGIRNKITDSYPCMFHFNGGSKDNLSLREPILKHLNLV